MNKQRNQLCLIAIISISFLTGCQDGPSDQDRAFIVDEAEVLTQALLTTSYAYEAHFNRYDALWAQYWAWGPGVSSGDWCRFRERPKQYNRAWEQVYRFTLPKINIIKNSENATYRAVGGILEAFTFQYMVDHFGDLPYSSIIQENSNGSQRDAVYDDDAFIYKQLISSLDAAIINLQVGDPMEEEDILFDGNVKQWAKFANSLKLRMLMRITDVEDVQANVIAIVHHDNFLEMNQAEIQYSGTPGNENPMYAYNQTGIGQFLKAATTVIDILDETQDPRLHQLYDEERNHPGQVIGLGQNEVFLIDFPSRQDYSDPSSITYAADVPVIFMSTWESYFLRAEAALKFNTGENTEFLFNQAIHAVFDYLNTEGAAEFIAGLNFGSCNLEKQLKLIAIQKWISMTGLQEAEGWTEARRFDTPATPYFTSVEGVFQTPVDVALPARVFPTRWLYPESEERLNPNFPGQVSLTDKVFWDR